jgi:WD40 repeat protein
MLAGDYRGNISFHPNGEQFDAIVDDSAIAVLDASSGKIVNTFKHEDRLVSIRSVIWRPEDQKLLFSTVDGTRLNQKIQLWDAKTA